MNKKNLPKNNNKKYFSYLSFHLLIDNFLNVNNLEIISKNDLLKIEKLFDQKHFYNYKKKIFWKWDRNNFENTIKYYKRFFKLINKLELKMNDYEKDKIYLYKAKYFTKIRNLKTIEAYYNDETLSEIIYFHYHNVSIFKEKDNIFEKKFEGDFSVSYTEMVFYDQNTKIINFVIFLKDIEKILFEEKWLKIVLKNKKSYFLKYMENEIIYISLRRLWSDEIEFF